MTKIKNISGIIPKKSSTQGSVPSASQLQQGEIAINYNVNDPFISVKTSDNSVKRLDAPKQLSITPKSCIDTAGNHWWLRAYQVGKLVVINASFGVNQDCAQNTVLATGFPTPSSIDTTFVVFQGFDAYKTTALQVVGNDLVVREGSSLVSGAYYSGVGVYICQ